jgi:pSer/pThr/pTyr-binding forkhead associated (FHA) protein
VCPNGCPGVSRRHAEFIVGSGTQGVDCTSPPVLTLRDLDSTFGTSVNSTALVKGEARILRHGDLVRFGLQSSALRVTWEPLCFCLTRLGKREKAALRLVTTELGATLVSDWGPQVTHLATSKGAQPA